MESYSAVSSVQNSMVKHAHSLTVPKKLRESTDFLCEGFHLVRDALASGVKVRYVLATPTAESRPEGKDLAVMSSRAKTRWVRVSEKIIQYLSDTPSPQGIVAVAAKPELRWPLEPLSLALVAHGVQDPGNTGALIRTAEAAGASGVILTGGCCDPFNPKAVRAAMGSLFRIPVQSGVPWSEALEWLRGRGVVSTALMPRADRTLGELTEKPRAYWVGSEGEGLPEKITSACDERVRIPMGGQVESLNVGASAAIALFYKAFRGAVP